MTSQLWATWSEGSRKDKEYIGIPPKSEPYPEGSGTPRFAPVYGTTHMKLFRFRQTKDLAVVNIF